MATASSPGRRRRDDAESAARYEPVPRIGSKGGDGRRRRRASAKLSAVSTLIDQGPITVATDEEGPDNETSSNNNNNPRSFSHAVKQQCWEKAEKVRGRDPERWRRDPLGNLVFRKLVGCPGCVCYDFDHILPFSKGGRSSLENCQVLQVCSWSFSCMNIHFVLYEKGNSAIMFVLHLTGG
ncbi:hypothetical protein EJ110_NYTH59268 [Nymphaea thermarum]|nr:hypothetical protein EJ110_NYTH59268 [Nymphaea thermarum]